MSNLKDLALPKFKGFHSIDGNTKLTSLSSSSNYGKTRFPTCIF